VGFEPTISAGEWPQTYDLDRAATGTGNAQIAKELKITPILDKLLEYKTKTGYNM
jgi:hypothetical protein